MQTMKSLQRTRNSTDEGSGPKRLERNSNHKTALLFKSTYSFQCLQIIGEFEGSEEESTVALQPANIKKNRFRDILPCECISTVRFQYSLQCMILVIYLIVTVSN